MAVLLLGLPLITVAQTRLRVMSANITSGNGQSYEPPGIRIFQGFKPDVVAIQEFRYQSSSASNDLRQLVNTAFGSNFNFYCEPGYNIPNGIVSRWPIRNAGSLPSPEVSDRGFAWAQLDIPGTNDLYVVSVHLYGGGTATDRNTEALVIKEFVQTNFPAGAWVIVAGDFNTGSRDETCVNTFKTILSDSPIPDDHGITPDADTNEPRSKPYDYLLPSFALATHLTPVALTSQTLTNGLVFDSNVFTPLSDVSPVLPGDSHVSGMQHMAVVKDFLIPSEDGAPEIAVQPQDQTVAPGSNVAFYVEAYGAAPLAYRWYFNETNQLTGETNTYSINSVQSTNAGGYSVIIANVYGSVTSSVARLIVTNLPPSIITQPQSQSVKIGEPVSFAVNATGAMPLSFQWRFDGTNLFGANSNVFNLAAAQSTNAGMYDVVITNVSGSITSEPAVLTINAVIVGTNIVLAGWDVSGQSGYGASPLPPSSTAPTLTVSGLTRGSGVTLAGTAADRAWGGNGFDAASVAAAIAANDFATFSISNSTGHTISFASINRFDYRRSSSGPANGVIQYQINHGGFSDIAALSYSSTSSSGSSLGPIDLSTVSALQNLPVGNVVTFRIVNHGGSSGGNWYVYDRANNASNDLEITGILNPVATAAADPAVLESPVLLSGNRFQFTVNGTAGSNYVTQVSTNLALTNWIPLVTNAAPFILIESNVDQSPQRFYRAVTAP